MAFAAAVDVATRLGRDLTAEEGATAEMLLDAVTAVIASAAGKTDAWAAALTPVPDMLKFLAVEVVVRSMRNSGGLRSQSETLGQYQHSESYQDASAGGGMMLTKVEEMLVRRVIYGTLSGSARVKSVANDPCVICNLIPRYCDGFWICGCDDDCGS